MRVKLQRLCAACCHPCACFAALCNADKPQLHTTWHQGNGISRVLLGVSGPKDLWAYAALPGKLPAGVFQVTGAGSDADAVLLGWALGTYKFGRYKTNRAAGAEGQGATDKPRLLPPEEPAR